MQEVKRVINKNQQTVDEEGAVVEERAQSVETEVDSKVTVANIVWYIYGFVAIVLVLRFVMKLAGANSDNAFVSALYTISGIFSAPFDTIFGVSSAKAGAIRSVFEPSILVAIAIYALIAWGIVKLLTLNEPKKSI